MPKAKKYRAKANNIPLSFQIGSSGRSVALAPKEVLNPDLTEDEYKSLDIQRLIDKNHLFVKEI